MSAPPAQPPSGGFSLFPNTSHTYTQPPTHPRKQPPRPARRSESRERSRGQSVERTRGQSVERTRGHAADPARTQTPVQSRPSIDVQAAYTAPPGSYSTPSRTIGQARSSPVESPSQQTQSPQETVTNNQSPLEGRQSAMGRREDIQVQRPRPAADVPERTETAFSQANTLVRSNSTRSRSSIAKLPLEEGEPSSAAAPPEAPIRSMFPTYNPQLPLTRQDYFPTQTSPTHIPRAVISRTGYHGPPEVDVDDSASQVVRSPAQGPHSPRSPEQATTRGPWPRRPVYQEPPTIPTTCTTEQLKGLWKVTNGWKASASEGRVYCLKLTQEKDAPVYTLASATQPFYNLRLDPTSASAYVTLMRHDPSRPYKGPLQTSSAPTGASSILSGITGHGSGKEKVDTKSWQEALTTTLEEESRKHPPNDGLVALLYPSNATRMALDRPDDLAVVMMAERECARLVWDEDSHSHFLVHPALATPFCITIERSPSWSRTEYTLEHHESPQHLAKLTRDGTGAGWLEVDTGLAAKIESFFIIDVAVTALVLVAAADEKHAKMETFEPPPAIGSSSRSVRGSGGSILGDHHRFSGRRSSSKAERREERRAKKRGKMEEFELDLESQNGSFNKLETAAKEKTEKLPFVLRVIVKILTAFFKCFIWCLSLAFRTLTFTIRGVLKCTGDDK